MSGALTLRRDALRHSSHTQSNSGCDQDWQWCHGRLNRNTLRTRHSTWNHPSVFKRQGRLSLGPTRNASGRASERASCACSVIENLGVARVGVKRLASELNPPGWVYQVLSRKGEDAMPTSTLHVTCPKAFISFIASEKNLDVAQTSFGLASRTPEISGISEKVVANPKTVTEIKAFLPHMSDFAIAKALHANRQMKGATVASLLGGTRNFKGSGWAAYQVTTNDVDGHKIVSQEEEKPEKPAARVRKESSRSMGFDDSLGVWDVDTKITAATVDPYVIAPSKVTDDLTPYAVSGIPKAKAGLVSFLTRKDSFKGLKEETEAEKATRERIEEYQRLRHMGFDDTLGHWGQKQGDKKN
eukprot:1176968-Prorocentrum_minimum.AAC.1